MPEFVDGLPLHPLVVHFVVVLIVLAVLGSLLTAVWPAVRRRFGWLVVAGAAAGTALVPVATSSGGDLATRLPANELIQKHEALGDLMLWWALGLTVAVGALMVVSTMAERAATAKVVVGAAGAAGEEAPRNDNKKALALAVIALAVVTFGVAVGAGIHVYRTGDAGSRAVWEGVENLPPQNGG